MATRTRRRSRSSRASGRRQRAPARSTLQLRESVARQLGGHAPDAAAIALTALGVITALGVYSDLAGPVGEWLADALGAVLGRVRYTVPFALLGLAGFAVVAGRPRRGSADEDDAPSPEPLRVGAGVVLVAVATVGLLDLAAGSPPLSAPATELRGAGGWLGAVVGGPLRGALGPLGAVVVLVLAAVLGALLAPGIPLRAVFGALGRALRWSGGALRRSIDLSYPEAEVTDDEDGDDWEETEAPRAVAYDELFDTDADDVDDVDDADVADDDFEAEPVEPEVEPAAFYAHVPVAPAVAAVAEPDGQLMIDLGSQYAPGDWKLPPRNILERSQAREQNRRAIEDGGRVLEATLHEFDVDASLTGMTIGPTVTRYELELGLGVKVNRVTNLSHDIAYALASPDVRILAPIPGRSAIGVEVPNRVRQLVTLGDILATDEARRVTHPLEIALGRDISGRPVMLNLATMPHLLIAGQTGAGKSSCISSIITSILMRSTPDEVRLILVDPKRVELGAYNDVPHLLTPVVTNPKKAAHALDWAVREMELRYDLLAEVGVRDITGYNVMYERGDLPTADDPDPETGKHYDRLPFLLIVIDELNDLMMVAARDVEQSICRIAQMARAVGLHLVIATQRPSVDVITGVIKANIPSRFAFSVSSLADSRVILDQPGAEKLIGQGDMLMVTTSSSRAQRVQVSWVDEACVRKVTAHWRRQVTELRYVEGLDDDGLGAAGGVGAAEDDDDELLMQAMELVVRSGFGSTSMLQRKLRVGFSRAGRMMDLLERKGVVGPSEGSKARAVLMTVDELEDLLAKQG